MKRHLFSKIIVAFCVCEMAFMQIWAMHIAGRNLFLVTGLLTVNHAVFGGELLLLCVKRIMEKEKKQKEKEEIDICKE